jgi:hypothetical protein
MILRNPAFVLGSGLHGRLLIPYISGDRRKTSMRQALAFLALFALLTFFVACGGDDDSSASGNSNDINANMADTGASERANNSNIAPTGGPGPEPENAGQQPAKESKDKKADANKKTK